MAWPGDVMGHRCGMENAPADDNTSGQHPAQQHSATSRQHLTLARSATRLHLNSGVKRGKGAHHCTHTCIYSVYYVHILLLLIILIKSYSLRRAHTHSHTGTQAHIYRYMIIIKRPLTPKSMPPAGDEHTCTYIQVFMKFPV